MYIAHFYFIPNSMTLRLLIVTILFYSYCSFHCLGQTVISGQILDDKSTQPLPYANVKIKSKLRGTVSNLDGQFTLNILEEDIRDTIVISYIGYYTISIAIQDAFTAQPNFTVRLKESLVTLKEVTVKPLQYLDNPSKIVSQAITKIPKNCYPDEFIIRGFFRQIHREDDTYKRLIEAAITIHDKGYSVSNKENRIDIPELRKSYDLREIRNESIWGILEGSSKIKRKNVEGVFSDSSKQMVDDIRRREQRFVSVRDFLSKDLIRSYLQDNDGRNFGLLNKDFIRNHKFKLDTISSYNEDEVYVVKILPSSKSEEYFANPRSLIIPVGKVYIRTSDFAILQLDYNYILNPKKKGSEDYNLRLRTTGSGIAFSISIMYSEHNGKLHLSSIRTFEPDPIAYGGQSQKRKESGYTRGYFFLERNFIVTEVITDKPEISKLLGANKWNEDIYTQAGKYNSQFWKKNSVLKETAKEEKLINDLQKKAKLDEQFKKDN
jgi:hypothetical protein